MTRGVTLIETLVYLALFTLVMGGLMSAAYGLSETSGRNQTKAMVQEEKLFLAARITRTLDGASSVSVPAVGTSGSSLVLTHYDGTAASLCLSGGDMLYLAGTGSCASAGVPLDTPDITVTNLVFIHRFSGGASPESIEAGFTVSMRTPGGMIISQSASTTRYIRR